MPLLGFEFKPQCHQKREKEGRKTRIGLVSLSEENYGWMYFC
jgi:hypothetical protein